jgi:hypothetical protein
MHEVVLNSKQPFEKTKRRRRHNWTHTKVQTKTFCNSLEKAT